jgi:hypothetical protein
MNPRVRKFALTAHVVASVGWLGAVVGFLALAVAALTSDDSQTVRSALLAAEITVPFALVPLACASVVTGLVQGLGTPWGLFRHYWVTIKLVLAIVATLVLLMYTRTIGDIAEEAADPASSVARLHDLALSPVLHAGLALLVLLATTTLAVFKPRGVTPYGRRKRREERAALTVG